MKAFRDVNARFTEKKATVFGISTDDVETQARFKKELDLPFELLADEDKTASKAFGVLSAGVAKRVTFVIDTDGTIVDTVEGSDAIDPSGALAACPLPKKDTPRKDE